MKILNKLTIKHLTMNKKRTIVTIIGIILSTALMVGIGLLFSTLQDNAIRTVKKENGDYHVKISKLPSSKLGILNNNHHIDTYFFEQAIGFSKVSTENATRKYIFVGSVSEDYWKQVTLIRGNFPKNETEIVISKELNDNGIFYEIGDEITLQLGPRVVEETEIYENNSYQEEEEITVKEEKTYTVVGVMEPPVFQSWDAAGYSCLTTYTPSDGEVKAYIRFKKPTKTFEYSKTLIKNLGMENVKTEDGDDVTEYNNSLLSLYGASRYNNIVATLRNVMVIVLTLISVGCIVVIYNSFAISVMERKKQFGLFSSIGATKKQLRHTVFFEAFLVGIIGIPIGIMSSFIGIGTVLYIINCLLPDLFGMSLVLTAYPTFIIIPVIFMIVTIFISAYLPAHKASKITPIEAIRLNDDIKIKHKKLKTGRWVKKLFGIEGDIAFKNIKRNKKKYRITIASLFISIVLFISFSTFVEYGLQASSDTLSIPDYDIYLMLKHPTVHNYQNFMKEVIHYQGVEKNIIIKSGNKYSNSYKEQDIYSKQILDKYKSNQEFLTLTLISLDKNSYQSYLKELGLKEERPILINKIKYIDYSNQSRKVYTLDVVKSQSYSFDLCEFKKTEETSETDDSQDETVNRNDFTCTSSLKNVYLTEKAPFAIETEFLIGTNIVLVIPEETFNEIFPPDAAGYLDEYSIYLKASNYKKVDEYIMKYIEEQGAESYIDYFNYPKDMKMVNNLYLVIAILLYGFITLVTLIGVTSVFNTINTSIALRRKEFAVLRSMGLTPHGFNRILSFESFFFGIKSLLYAVPFSFLVVLWIHVSMINVKSFDEIMIPWKSVGIAVFAVFLIIFATMMYATKKMKKENILEAIREENI